MSFNVGPKQGLTPQEILEQQNSAKQGPFAETQAANAQIQGAFKTSFESGQTADKGLDERIKAFKEREAADKKKQDEERKASAGVFGKVQVGSASFQSTTFSFNLGSRSASGHYEQPRWNPIPPSFSSNNSSNSSTNNSSSNYGANPFSNTSSSFPNNSSSNYRANSSAYTFPSNFQGTEANKIKGELERILGATISDANSLHVAFNKWSLKNHPDKVDVEQRVQATEAFQKVVDLRDRLVELKKW